MAKKHTTREMRSQRRTQKKIGLENALRERWGLKVALERNIWLESVLSKKQRAEKRTRKEVGLGNTPPRRWWLKGVFEKEIGLERHSKEGRVRKYTTWEMRFRKQTRKEVGLENTLFERWGLKGALSERWRLKAALERRKIWPKGTLKRERGRAVKHTI